MKIIWLYSVYSLTKRLNEDSSVVSSDNVLIELVQLYEIFKFNIEPVM